MPFLDEMSEGAGRARHGMRRAIWIALCALIAAQLVPVPRDNPPVKAEIRAPAEVQRVFERACYDCHSYETRWPWYSRLAPVSWLVAYDVKEGREHLNFSRWGELRPKDRAHAREEVAEVIEEGEMPPWFYLPLHPEARLGSRDRELLRAWSEGLEDPTG